MSARKTVEIQKLLDYANGFLAAKGGTAESRYGVICVLEATLNAAGRYRGFYYLAEDEVGPYDKPGIRWGDDYVAGDPNRFENTDSTRRRYA